MFYNKWKYTADIFQYSLYILRQFSEKRVVVTGLGAVTPLGNSVNKSWSELISGKSSVTHLKGDMYQNLPCKIAAQVNRDELNLENLFSKSDLKCLSTATQFALIATKEALAHAELEITDNNRDRIGVCVGMGMFNLSDVYNSFSCLQKSYNRLSPYFIPKILPNMACGQISIKYGLRGPNHSISTACSTGAHAIGDAFRFIKHGDADIMVCGSGEASIDPLSVAGFCRLRALSTSYNNEPEKASRPFDKKRDGFVMGEGAAILVLEDLKYAKSRGATIHAEILGYGLSGDAYHITSPREDGIGAKFAMLRAINDAKINLEKIHYINAHATSTSTGDKIEAKAISDLFGTHSKNLQVSSTKGAHGHLLGSSGNLEALFTIMACKHNLIPPSINIEQIEDDIDFDIIQKAGVWNTNEQRIALKNSFGFGGTNACLCISNYCD